MWTEGLSFVENGNVSVKNVHMKMLEFWKILVEKNSVQRKQIQHVL